jgi:hypothetical protein
MLIGHKKIFIKFQIDQKLTVSTLINLAIKKAQVTIGNIFGGTAFSRGI